MKVSCNTKFLTFYHSYVMVKLVHSVIFRIKYSKQLIFLLFSDLNIMLLFRWVLHIPYTAVENTKFTSFSMPILLYKTITRSHISPITFSSLRKNQIHGASFSLSSTPNTIGTIWFLPSRHWAPNNTPLYVCFTWTTSKNYYKLEACTKSSDRRVDCYKYISLSFESVWIWAMFPSFFIFSI